MFRQIVQQNVNVQQIVFVKKPNVCGVTVVFIVLHFVSIVYAGFIDNHGRYARDDSSASDDGGGDSQSTIFMIGSGDYMNQTSVVTTPNNIATINSMPLLNNSISSSQSNNNIAAASNSNNFSNLTSAHSVTTLTTPSISSERLVSTRLIRQRRRTQVLF